MWKKMYYDVIHYYNAAIAYLVCSNPNRLKCFSKALVSWESNGCHYSCYQKKLSFATVKISWCQRLSKQKSCIRCPGMNPYCIYILCF